MEVQYLFLFQWSEVAFGVTNIAAKNGTYLQIVRIQRLCESHEPIGKLRQTSRECRKMTDKARHAAANDRHERTFSACPSWSVFLTTHPHPIQAHIPLTQAPSTQRIKNCRCFRVRFHALLQNFANMRFPMNSTIIASNAFEFCAWSRSQSKQASRLTSTQSLRNR